MLHKTLQTALNGASKKRHFSQNLLSDLNMGIYRYHLEKGKQMSCIALARIADYLDCSVDYLLGRTDNPAVNR